VPLYLGFDASTQSLTAVVVEIDGAVRRVVHEDALTYDEELPHYGTRHGVLPSDDPAVAVSPPLISEPEHLELLVEGIAAGLDRLDDAPPQPQAGSGG
jgi:xylulokinase